MFGKLRSAFLIVSGAALMGGVLGSATDPVSPAQPPVNFQRQVRPILSDNCFLCHGPDKGTRMADVRLDIREGAFATRKNGTIIVPGKPEESLLIKRILSDDPGYRMPPVFSHKTLTQDQKSVLRRWVAEGAQWKDHWAFIAPVRPPLPPVKDSGWVRNPVDQFILSKLEANGLKPAAEADRRALIRRVTLDLTGLPPTPAEVEAFVRDGSPNAYETVVDRLFASPKYGEHMAHYWLDAARYADTHGLHIDNYREMWPYRDWVIKAFNNNMPFDQFTIEQLAGDLLPNATLDQKIASGFQRCNVTTNEGGSIPAEVMAMYAKDRADTTGTVWMGLTVGCATCHDHKFDPIAQKEYYSLTSFFRNTTQYPLDGNVPDSPPIVTVPRAEDRQRWDELQAQRANLKSAIAKAQSESNAAFETWLRSPARHQVAAPLASSQLLALKLGDGVQAVRHGRSESLVLPSGVSVGDGPPGVGKALRFGKEGALQLPNVSEIDTDKPFTIASWVLIPKADESYVLASQVESRKNGASTRKWGWTARVTANNGEPSMPSINLEGRDGKYISAQPAPSYGLKPATWYHLIFTYDGSRSGKGLKIYIDGNPVPSYGTGEDLAALETSIATAAPLLLAKRNNQFFENGAMAGFRIFDRRVDEQDAKLLFVTDVLEAAARKDVADLSQADRGALLAYYVAEVDPAAQETVAKLHKVDTSRYEIARRSAVTFVQEERADAQPVAHVLYRGQYDQMRDEVHPNVPAVLPPMSQSAPRNRLGLAQWLIEPSNPLTARVTVNRFWQQVFGTGLVKTAEDFGSQGEPPSHPELLDWLAMEFRESGWDVKKTLRLFVTSAVYRQSAAATPDKIERDLENRLLSRGPRYRMDAEMIRDYALAVSGLLVPQIGGPSVKPYQPPKIWETVAMDNSNTRFYKADSGEGLYRRSLYTFWKRSAPPASMDIFNAPSREVCIVRRERTNTPLQALVTMNDPQFVEAARVLAQNALLDSRGDFDRQVDYISNRLLARNLDEKERAVAVRSYRDYFAYYTSAPADAAKLVRVGASKPAAGLPVPSLAAMTMLTNELMNLDEVLVK
ncbi:MAG: Protein of unknown function (DUF1553)/Protein of unknown function (DUF1549)/Planctomycete [Bryobacterales bacterium]|nr:Protein of unknown function (DUF1553)/Protein of unknown function (DUF1549)/Planctomycete [Bryobacterales bacterium]